MADDPILKRDLFTTRKDEWFLAALLGIPLFPALLSLILLLSGAGDAAWVFLGLALIGGLLSWALTVPTYYRFKEDALEIRGGVFFGFAIPYSDILSIEPVSAYRLAPAWSAERLRLTYALDEDFLRCQISPENAEGFCDRLAEACPRLERLGPRTLADPALPNPPTLG